MANDNLPPINANQPIVDPKSGKAAPAFILFINQLLKKVATSANAAIATLLAKSIDSTTLAVTGTYADQIDVELKPLAPAPTGTYGDATHYPVVTLDQYGRVTHADVEPAAGAITVQDGTTSVANVSNLKFTSGAVVTAGVAGEADVAISGGGGGGSSGSLVKLAEVTLTVAGPTLSATGILGTYNDLVCVISGQGTASSPTIYVFANGDHAAHYDSNTSNKFGTSQAYATASPRLGAVEGSTALGSYFTDYEATFIDYARTTSWKRAFSRQDFADASNMFAEFEDWGWRSTAAINQLDFTLSAGNWVVGSRLTIYGRGGPAGAGGGGDDFKLLSEVILAATATTVSFTGINQGYRDLTLVSSECATVLTDAPLFLNFNGDTGNNYNWSIWSAFERTQTLNTGHGGWGNNEGFDTAGQEWPSEATIYQYAATDRHKHWKGEADLYGGGNFTPRFYRGFWNNNAAINQIDLTISGGLTFSIGSKFQLYGRGKL